MPLFRRRRKEAETAPDLAGLAKLARETGDRAAPVHFAGRASEIQEIEWLLGGARDRTPGLTHVVTAAPGAGKTALLGELAERWRKSGAARPVLLPASMFADPEEVLREMFVALSDPAAERFGAVETETETQHAEGGMRAGLTVKAGAASERSVQRATLPRSFSEAFRLLADRETPVVLLVDEAQEWGANQDAADGRRTSSLLIEAHTNLARLPLLIVAAGLGDAREAIARRGASKRKTDQRPMVLGRLKPQEMEKVAQAFFERFRIAGSAELRAEWTEALIKGADGWPRHLTNALRGAAEALIAAEGDLARASLDDARESAEAYRRRYYSEQIDPFRSVPELLEAVIAVMPERAPESKPESKGASRAAISKAIDRAYEATPRLAREMPLPPAEIFRSLLHKGLLQDFGEDRYACPIPSFKTYVEDFCAEQKSAPGSGAWTAPASPSP